MGTLSIRAPNLVSPYEYEYFISAHTIVRDYFSYSSVVCTLSSYTISCPGATNVSVTITGSTLIVSGYYGDVFTESFLQYRTDDNTNELDRKYSFSELPKYYWKATRYRPDMRATTTIAIQVVTDQGIIDTTQTIKNNWDLRRKYVFDFIKQGDLNEEDLFVDGALMQIPGLQNELRVPKTTSLTISANVANFILTPSVVPNYVTGVTTVELTIQPNVAVYSTNTSQAALIVRDFAATDTIKIINYGFIVGKGGKGGDGPDLARASAGGSGYDGGQGGPAIEMYNDVLIDNRGTIGGGGGGGGAMGGPQYAGGTWYYTYGGAGGGGGAGFGDRGVKSAYSAGGVQNGNSGNVTTGGIGGSGTAYGKAGDGGSLGQPGTSGPGTITNVLPGGGSGGQPGKAVLKLRRALHWINQGTVLGDVV